MRTYVGLSHWGWERWILVPIFFFCTVLSSYGQTATVKRNVNLRHNPSSNQAPIRLLLPPEELTLLSSTKLNGYYNVATDANEEGWVWAANVEVVGALPLPVAPRFPDAHDPPITGWIGPVFKLSQDYPQTMPPADPRPWKQLDFKTQSDQYLRSVLDYAKDGNLQVDWQGDQNQVRKWYHAPWLHTSSNGREFVHGLTRERTSRPGELHAQQTSSFANYAVGLYNPSGGYTVGQVWHDPDNPNASAAQFSDGAVAVKLLFTTATVAEVPYLVNSFEWDAHISSVGSSSARTIQKVRLLQIDVAVRDSRADSTTGWVFGTFAYDGNASGATVWERMMPIGLMWGNDPTLTPAQFQSGSRPVEALILNRTVGIMQHLGWLERLNGPVDNPRSSCLSCHSTAQDAALSAPVPGASLSDTQKMNWFRNIKAGDPFDIGQQSLDYSLQLSEGIKRWRDNQGPPNR